MTKTHGVSGTPTYRCWEAMLARCSNSEYKNYKNIEVCERWRKFENFLEDMGERPNGLTLERKDNSKGYYKENCKWATYIEQLKNRRNTVNITFDGKTKCLSDWIDLLGINKRGLVSRRISNGWSFARAVTTISNTNKTRRDRR